MTPFNSLNIWLSLVSVMKVNNYVSHSDYAYCRGGGLLGVACWGWPVVYHLLIWGILYFVLIYICFRAALLFKRYERCDRYCLFENKCEKNSSTGKWYCKCRPGKLIKWFGKILEGWGISCVLMILVAFVGSLVHW